MAKRLISQSVCHMLNNSSSD